MKVTVFSIHGKKIGDIQLPYQFEEVIRPDLIKRSVLAIKSHNRQPYGVDIYAGLKTSARFRGLRDAYGTWADRGFARISRIRIGSGHMSGVGRRVPESVKGRRAHPPLAEKVWKQKINKKERRKAIRSAIAATADKSLVEKRNHKIGSIKQFPIIVEDKIEGIKTSKEVFNVLNKIGLGDDLERVSKKKVRAGRGKMRGRKYKRKKGSLIVIAEDTGIMKSARNISGVDISLVQNLNTDLLAPGTQAGRLTIYTKGAIEKLRKEKLFM